MVFAGMYVAIASFNLFFNVFQIVSMVSVSFEFDIMLSDISAHLLFRPGQSALEKLYIILFTGFWNKGLIAESNPS